METVSFDVEICLIDHKLAGGTLCSKQEWRNKKQNR